MIFLPEVCLRILEISDMDGDVDLGEEDEFSSDSGESVMGVEEMRAAGLFDSKSKRMSFLRIQNYSKEGRRVGNPKAKSVQMAGKMENR
eukprot:TRINITY_DN4183_c1_g1_i1.p1 TRINITY_DN4183_c1_g1~~TRINITY_DN4183_c1_g1_i1.p1  ORF type:complete len:89 (+),score=25.79 TRINITY_DN4183_c1_g1_i1:114-380(+)